MSFDRRFMEELLKSEFLFPRAVVSRIELEVRPDGTGTLVLIQPNPDDSWTQYGDEGDSEETGGDGT